MSILCQYLNTKIKKHTRTNPFFISNPCSYDKYMKRLNHLWQSIITFDNLLLAYKKALCGKRQKSSVAQFTLNLESELFTLQQQLADGSYQPGKFHITDAIPRWDSIR